MARLGEVHPSFADLADAALDTKRLSSALDELAAVQAGGEKPLWQLRNAPLSEGDADSLPGFTPRSSTPLHDPGLPPGEDGGRGSSSAEHRHGGGGGAAWRHYGAYMLGRVSQEQLAAGLRQPARLARPPSRA